MCIDNRKSTGQVTNKWWRLQKKLLYKKWIILTLWATPIQCLFILSLPSLQKRLSASYQLSKSFKDLIYCYRFQGQKGEGHFKCSDVSAVQKSVNITSEMNKIPLFFCMDKSKQSCETFSVKRSPPYEKPSRLFTLLSLNVT